MTALFVYAFLIEPKLLKVREHVVGEGAREVKVVLVTDIHIGGIHVSQKRVGKLVHKINSLDPDIVLSPGDFINGHTPRDDLSDDARNAIDDGIYALADIKADKIATLGNHDRWHSEYHVRKALEGAGFFVLENQSLNLRGVCFVGLADSDTATPNKLAFSACDPKEPIIALMHSPDARALLPIRTSLAVAGHTHGGQVNLPFLGRFVTSTKCGIHCAYGKIQTQPPLFVSAGIGTSILPIRFRSPPEIMVFTLRLP